MRLRLLLLALCATALAIAGPARSDTITFKPRLYPLGLWVDGMAFDGKSIWVAELGQGTIAQLNSNYAVARRIKVEGVPGKMDVGQDGAIYALLQTDEVNKVWQQFPSRAQGTAIAGLEGNGCASALASGGGPFVWVLYGCNGENAVLLKIDPKTDPKTGARMTVPLGSGGGELMVRQGRVWVNTDRLSVVDETTLAVRTSDVLSKLGPEVFPGPFAADADKIYVATIGGGTSHMVLAIDPATLQETARAPVDQAIEAITADAQHVVALGVDGRIFVLSAGRLELQRVINLTVEHVEPRKAMIRNGDLLITDFRVKNERGALLVLHGWRPAAAAASSR